MKDNNRKEEQSGPLNVKFLILSSQITVKERVKYLFSVAMQSRADDNLSRTCISLHKAIA